MELTSTISKLQRWQLRSRRRKRRGIISQKVLVLSITGKMMMGKISKISWTRSTYNHWWICTEYGLGCDLCYAREFAARFGYKWGKGVPRRFFGQKHNREPYNWNEKAKLLGEVWRVFAMSMADWADDEVDRDKREEFFTIVRETEHLTWLLLTKRVKDATNMLPADWGKGYPNVKFGITCATQKEANRDIPKMLKIPALSYWISAEPQLDDICYDDLWLGEGKIEQIVTGGESGSGARPYDVEWARNTIRQCRESKIAAFVKQFGSNPLCHVKKNSDGRVELPLLLGKSVNYKWDQPECWPEDLRVQEFPR
jgi:protein gp37